MKKAVLHCSYSAPVFVSVTDDVVAARAETFRWGVVERADAFVTVFDDVFLGIRIVTGLVDRADTFVFKGVREDIERVALAVVVEFVFLLRVALFSVRTAAPALNTQNKPVQTKSKIFFISGSILAKL